MKADKEKIVEVLNSSVSTSELSRKTGIAVMTLSDLRNRVDDSKIDKMQFRTAAKLQKYWEELQMKNIKDMTVEDFYNLDEVSMESDGFYFTDEENDISEMVPTPEEAFLPEDEWNGEDYTDHLHPAYLPAWKELQDKVAEAYESI